jgi:hypothetical protein
MMMMYARRSGRTPWTSAPKNSLSFDRTDIRRVAIRALKIALVDESLNDVAATPWITGTKSNRQSHLVGADGKAPI